MQVAHSLFPFAAQQHEPQQTAFALLQNASIPLSEVTQHETAANECDKNAAFFRIAELAAALCQTQTARLCFNEAGGGEFLFPRHRPLSTLLIARPRIR